LRFDAAKPSISTLLSRRQFLKAAGATVALLGLPFNRTRRAFGLARARFFTRHELRTLEALCERVIPADHDPGARALRAAHYISGLLTALDRPRPRIYAGGPFSGRTPLPNNDDGTPSTVRPANTFRTFLPLTRLQELKWRAELFGSDTVPEFAPIDAQIGNTKRGLRTVYREALAKVDEVSLATKGQRFILLAPADQDSVFMMLDSGAFASDPRRDNKTFITLLIQHTLEGCFAAPEYGGNHIANGQPQGWAMLGLEGDSQPLGYSVFSRALDDYVERADHPMSTPNPDELDGTGMIVPRPLTPDGATMQNSIVTLTGVLGDGC
jgi:hypothetical protein